MPEILQSERQGPVIVLTLNDPARRNPLGEQMVSALIDAVASINADMMISCVVISGAGPCFCAGGDLQAMREGHGMFGGTPAQMAAAYSRGIQRLALAMHELEVPTIAAVNGPAVGAGCDLALMCDMRLVAPEATFAESFLRVGLISGDGGAWFLPRVVGRSRAFQMAFTGDAIDAEHSLEWGIASEIVPADRLMERSLQLAQRITRHPGEALRMMKRLLRHGAESSLEDNLALAAYMQAAAQHSSDHREALDAALAGRPPKFTGR